MLVMTCTAMAQLPTISLKDINGKTINTAELKNGGKPFIIDFFATWCKPCNRELDAIAEVYDDWKEETGLKIIIVSNDQAHNTNKVKPLVDNHGWEYETVLLDPNYEFSKALGNNSGAMPYTVIVDGKGKIVYRHTGYTDGAETELIEKVRELLK
jgi:peroxiredoxin